jgi:predicted DsbA family dithiol-disulfide isomerase
MVHVTYYVEVVSSWCFWAEPAWVEVKQRYAGRATFEWKIAMMPSEAFPVSRNQCEWFYRRSGSVMRSSFMLNSAWFEPEFKPYLAPNYVVQAAKDLGAADDRARLAVSRAALLEGQKVGRWDVAAALAAESTALDGARLLAHAKTPEIELRVQQTTAEFHNLQVAQRPAFVIENSIGDRAVFSGIVRAEPLSAAIDALLEDEAAYASWKAHFGDPPTM